MTWTQRLYLWLVKVGVLKTIVHKHSPFDPCTNKCKPVGFTHNHRRGEPCTDECKPKKTS